MLVEEVDDRVPSGLSFLKVIGERTDAKSTALNVEHQTEQDGLKKSLS